MKILGFIKDYWIQITFLCGIIWFIIENIKSVFEALKCSLRNDILDIYDRCKNNKQITHYQLESIEYSFTIYTRLRGNSFVKEVVEKVHNFELID